MTLLQLRDDTKRLRVSFVFVRQPSFSDTPLQLHLGNMTIGWMAQIMCERRRFDDIWINTTDGSRSFASVRPGQ